MSDTTQKPVFFTLYESTFDNRVLEENRFEDVGWGDLVDLLSSEHQLAPNKTDVKLMAPVRFISQDDPACEHARVTKHEAEKRHLGSEGDTKVDAEGNPYTWRGAANVDSWSMLPVDIDGEQTIHEAKEFFADYTYVAYTSFSHLKDGSTEKFRLLLPLKQPVSHQDFTDRLSALKEWLGNVDLSTLAGARGFYLPSCPPERAHLAKRWYNEGTRLLDILSFKVPIPQHPKRKHSVATVTDALITDSEKEALLEKLRSTYLGNYEDWWKVASAMVAAGYTVEDFKRVTINGMMSEKSEADCERQWNKVLSREARGM